MPMLFLCYQMAAILGDERRARETFAALDPEYVNNHTRGLLISALATSGVSETDNGRRRRECVTVCTSLRSIVWSCPLSLCVFLKVYCVCGYGLKIMFGCCYVRARAHTH